MNGCLQFGREISIHGFEHSQRQSTNAVVRTDGLVLARREILIDDFYARCVLPDLDHLGARTNDGAELFLKRHGYLIHAADRLKHRRLPVDLVFFHQLRP
jgi:hypothetical protein